MDGSTFTKITSLTQLGQLHPGPHQEEYWSSINPRIDLETAQWCDGALWWDKQERKRLKELGK